MNETKHDENDAALSSILRDWCVNTTLPPRFQERVWQRLARGESRPAATPWSRLGGMTAWVNAALSQPALAVGYVTILLLAGLAAGYWQARVADARTSAALGSRYVQMMDPFQAPQHGP